MGMHVGLVASRTTVVELRHAFAETFPHLQEVDSAALADVNDLWRWMDAHRQLVSAAEWRPDRRGAEVIAFWQDGPQGKCRRRIVNVDGEVSVEGDPLPAETGIDTAAYDMEESERLARALGISALEHRDGIALWQDFSAVCVVDNTDYAPLKRSAPLPGSVSVEAPRPPKPWWKLW